MATPTPQSTTTTTAVKRPVRQLSIHEKLSAIQRVHEGESKASVARLIGVPESTLRGWCKNEVKLRTMVDKGGGGGSSPVMINGAATPPEKKAKLMVDEPLLASPEEVKVEDALSFWLRNQQQHSDPVKTVNNEIANHNHHHNHHNNNNNNHNNNNNNNPSWFWRWYKQFGVADQSLSPDEPLPLVVRHNKEPKETPPLMPLRPTETVLTDSNKETTKENTGTTMSDDEDDPPATAADALKHGERFLRWLECCSDPSVTAVQLLQFRYLLNNVRTCAQRRAANKTKTPPRSRRK